MTRYTYSRISRASANGDTAKSGVGWSAEAVAKFSALANQVKEDRRLLGKEEFNKELYKKVVLRSSAVAANKTASKHIATIQKPIPYDDLEDCNVYDSGEDDEDEDDDDDMS